MTSLTIGPVHTLVANIPYALPPRELYIRAQPITNIQISNDNTTYVAAVADANGMIRTAAAFIRDTVGGSLVRIVY